MGVRAPFGDTTVAVVAVSLPHPPSGTNTKTFWAPVNPRLNGGTCKATNEKVTPIVAWSTAKDTLVWHTRRPATSVWQPKAAAGHATGLKTGNGPAKPGAGPRLPNGKHGSVAQWCLKPKSPEHNDCTKSSTQSIQCKVEGLRPGEQQGKSESAGRREQHSEATTVAGNDTGKDPEGPVEASVPWHELSRTTRKHRRRRLNKYKKRDNEGHDNHLNEHKKS